MKTGDRVKHSGRTIQHLRDIWNGCGRMSDKSAARQHLDDAIAARGTVIGTGNNGFADFIEVKMDGENGVHKALPYMFEPSGD